jgi:hypothetical protein
MKKISFLCIGQIYSYQSSKLRDTLMIDLEPFQRASFETIDPLRGGGDASQRPAPSESGVKWGMTVEVIFEALEK